MDEQTAIPVPEEPGDLGPCRWCGEPAVGLVEVEKAKYTSARGARVMARRAIEAPACAEHIDIADRQEDEWDQTH